MKKAALFFLVWLIFLLGCSTAFAGADEVSLIKISKYNYHYVDAFGQYQKCSSSTSWFVVIVNNGTESSYTLQMPDEVSITGWYGTKHPTSDFSYKILDYGSDGFSRSDKEEIDFNGQITLPPYTTMAVFFTIGNIERYNLYWDTDVFFNIMIDQTALPVRGVLMQRGNGCAPEQICSAQILEGGYNSDGGDGLLVVKVANDMPDGAYITAAKWLRVSGTTADGEAWSQTLQDVIQWDTPAFTLSPANTKTITGTFVLPTELAGAHEQMDMNVHLSFPTSLFFGDFDAEKTISVRGGVHGIMSGRYASNGSEGTFTATLTNHLAYPVRINHPETGTAQNGTVSTTLNLTWDEGGAAEIPANSSITLSGSFTFAKPALAWSNNSLVIHTTYSYAGGNDPSANFTAAGNAVRDADPNPTLSSLGICRDYKLNDPNITIAYWLQNNASIDISAQLATTLAVADNVANAKITYTGCESYANAASAMESCTERIDSSSYITLHPGEQVKLTGTVKVVTAPADMEKSVRTALVYFPDGVRTVLFVGQTTESCTGFVLQPTEQPISPTATVVNTASPTASPTQTLNPTSQTQPTATGTLEPPLIITGTAAQTATPINTATAATTATPEITATPTSLPEGSSAVLSANGRYGSYSSCSEDKALSFSFSIQNSGTAEAQLDISKIYFYANESVLDQIRYDDCRLQDSGGVDPTCSEKLKTGFLTIYPDQTLTLDAAWLPTESIREESFTFYGRSREYDSINFEISASRSKNYCEADIEPVQDEEGNVVQSSVNEANGTTAVLTMTLSNIGNEDTRILPQSLNFPTASVTTYTATGEIYPNAEKSASKNAITIQSGEEFSLPANSSVLITLVLTLDSENMPRGTVPINWNFKIGDQVRNYSGTITLPEASISPTQPAPVIPVQPASTSSPSPVQPQGNNSSILPESSPVVFWKEEQRLSDLPATGFPSGKLTILENQPAELAYEALDGLRVEIPKIDSSAEIVSVPLDEKNQWAVTWLGARSGVLQGAALPGEGTAILAGHNHIDTGHAGPFAFLNQLAANDRIFVSDTQNHLLIYKVYDNQLIEPQNGAAIYHEAIPGSLVLITCEAEKPQGGYAYRRVVYAEPLQ